MEFIIITSYIQRQPDKILDFDFISHFRRYEFSILTDLAHRDTRT